LKGLSVNRRISVEVKVRRDGERKEWEEIETLFVVLDEGTEVNFFQAFVSLAFASNLPLEQLRWNYEGSSQGHYVSITNNHLIVRQGA
jgi:hypothetical protein